MSRRDHPLPGWEVEPNPSLANGWQEYRRIILPGDPGYAEAAGTLTDLEPRGAPEPEPGPVSHAGAVLSRSDRLWAQAAWTRTGAWAEALRGGREWRERRAKSWYQRMAEGTIDDGLTSQRRAL